MAASCESHSDTSGGFYQTALDTLMDSLQISSTTNLDAVHYNNTFLKHFSKVDEEKFFSFCSTIKRPNNKNDACSDTKVKDNIETNCQHSMNDNQTTKTATPALNITDTPKRTIACSRKQKLFANNDATEEAEEEEEEDSNDFKLKTRFTKTKKELSPQSLLLKKAIVRYKCQQRRQERMALSKKPIRASLRI